LQKWIIVPDTLPTPSTASWFAALSGAHVPGAIDLAKLASAVFPSGPGAGGGGGGFPVVALAIVEFSETLPAASRAATV